MTRVQLIGLATLGSASLLAGAYVFQMLGYAPCKLCVWQRYPHAAAILIGVLALRLSHAGLALAGALAVSVTAGVGAFHVGVEQGWWQGPSSCSAGSVGGMSADDLLDQIMAAPLVRCDEIAWQMAGISMAGWNTLLSCGLIAIWLMAARRA